MPRALDLGERDRLEQLHVLTVDPEQSNRQRKIARFIGGELRDRSRERVSTDEKCAWITRHRTQREIAEVVSQDEILAPPTESHVALVSPQNVRDVLGADRRGQRD